MTNCEHLKLAMMEELNPAMVARLAASTFKKPLVRLRGPLGEFLVRHDGWYNPRVSAFTAMEDIPGMEMNRGSGDFARKGTSFSSMLSERAGFKSPRILPFQKWKVMQQMPLPKNWSKAAATAKPIAQSAGEWGNSINNAVSNVPYFSRLFPFSNTEMSQFGRQLRSNGITDFFGRPTQGASYSMPHATFQPSSLFPMWRP